MSASSALNARTCLDNARWVLAAGLVCAGQAREYVAAAFDVDQDLSLGAGTAAAYALLRDVVSPLTGDRPVHADVAAAETLLEDGLLSDAVARAIDGDLV
jgi:histidine ammonia-lyase